MKLGKRLLHIFILIILVATDQITKIMAANAFSDGSSYAIFEDVLRLVFSKNTGASWGVMKGMNPFFMIFVSLVALLVLWFYFSLPAKKYYNPLRYATIILLSGAIGNLIDRFRVGYVIDFIYFELIDFPVFNLADCYITVSAALIILLVLVRYRNDDIKLRFFKKKKEAETDNSNKNLTTQDETKTDI